MGQKDYTDWNGPRRKSFNKPPRERSTHRARTPKRHKIPGIKCTADRYKALRIKVAFYQERVDRWKNDTGCLGKWSKEALKEYSQALKRMECDLRRRDLWRRIQEYL